MKNLVIALEKKIEGVDALVAEGYCPIECSFGAVSVVDPLGMDHHGCRSNEESVAIRAYRNFFGFRENDPRFVINHIDADCIFAIASLVGVLPHPESAYAKTLPAFKQKAWVKDLLPLAETIALIDIDPIGRDILALEFGNVLITWNSLFGFQADDELAAIAAVQGWRQLTSAPTAGVFLNAAAKSEKLRIDAALKDLEERGEKMANILVLNERRGFGFNEWYQRQPLRGGHDTASGWGNPIVVALTEQGNITFGIPNKEVAEELLGKGGLMNVFSKLNTHFQLAEGSGFGGREAVGGSPRGMKMSIEDAYFIAGMIQTTLK